MKKSISSSGSTIVLGTSEMLVFRKLSLFLFLFFCNALLLRSTSLRELIDPLYKRGAMWKLCTKINPGEIRCPLVNSNI